MTQTRRRTQKQSPCGQLGEGRGECGPWGGGSLFSFSLPLSNRTEVALKEREGKDKGSPRERTRGLGVPPSQPRPSPPDC